MSFARSKRANDFAACKVHWTLHLSGSALRIAFSRYALSEKAGRSANIAGIIRVQVKHECIECIGGT